MLILLNKLTLQKELQHFVTNNVLLEKSKSTTTTKQNIKHMGNHGQEAGLGRHLEV